MEFRLLGGVEAVDGTAPLPLGGPKQRALMALLLLNANQSVSREQIVDELWGDSPPATARETVNVYVSRIRKLLAGNGADAELITSGDGYALRLDPASIDVNRFQRLVDAGQRALADGEPGRAAAVLREALATWRGAPFAGVIGEQFDAERARLEELRLTALERRIDADLALGRHRELVAEIERLAAAHPYREVIRAQQMIALYRSDRQADALTVYADVRRRLHDELGLEPSETLRELHTAILRHEPELAAVRPPGEQLAQPAPPPVPRSSLFVGLIGAGLVLAGLAAGAGLLARVDEGSGTDVSPNAVAVIDPETEDVVAEVPVGIEPGPIAFGGGAVWAANVDDKTLSRIDLQTRAVTRTFPLDGTPTGVAAGPRGIWVAYGRLGSVARVDPAFGSVGQPLHVAGRGYSHGTADGAVADGPGGVWVAFGDSTIARIDDDGARVLKRGHVGSQPAAIALGSSAVWVANSGADSISASNPHSADEVATINVASRPRGIALGANAVWVTAFDDDAVSHVTGSSSRTIAVGDGPLGIAFGAGSVWVANSRDGTVSRIDPEQGEVVATIRVGHRPQGIAVGGGAVWVTVAP